MKLLGMAVREDRMTLGVTQWELQQKIDKLAAHERISVSSIIVQNIERGLKRAISSAERRLFAEALNLPPDRYLDLPLDPRVVIDSLTKRHTTRAFSGIERSIEFPPEYKQAGISILSYFAEVLSRKYPQDNVKVNILQDGNKVTMQIETLEGTVDRIERTLEEYGLVVTGKMAVDKFTDDRELVRELKTRLEVTSLELRLRQEFHLQDRRHYETRVSSLEERVAELNQLVSVGLTHANNLAEIFRAMIPQTGIQERVATSLETIATLSSAEETKENAAKLNAAIKTVRQESPPVYERFIRTLESIPAGIMANLATPWVQNILSSLSR